MPPRGPPRARDGADAGQEIPQRAVTFRPESPNLALGGPSDATDRGAWIPTISTSQFGATLGKWFGASPGELAVAFPNLSLFPSSDVGFML